MAGVILKGECEISGSINTRTEMHGDEKVIAMDIGVQMVIKRDKLCKLVREDLAIAALFNEKEPGHFEPLFQGKFGWIPLLGKYKDSRAIFTCGLDSTVIDFEKCTISKIKIDPQIGGMTAVKLMVQSEMNEVGKLIFDFAGGNWPVEIRLGKFSEVPKEDQISLPLGSPTDAPDEKLEDAIASDEKEQSNAEVAGAADPKADGKKKRAAKSKEPQSQREAGTRVRPSRSKAAIAEREAAKEAS